MRIVTTLLVGMCLSSGAARAADAGKEQQRFQGTWVFVSVEFEGKDVSDVFKSAKPAVKDNRLTFTLSGGGKITRLFKLYPDTMPRSVDFLSEDGKEVTSEGIYELKDGQLTLLVNVKDGVKDRPTSFAAKAKSGHILYVLKHE